ncbi:16S rRNA (uracil(1498)-N(3))-methyltransferase [Maribacter sp. 2210JD10-5]|uniref:16S rRNA (uracil(1498)-N(3))-methyltransferase n=1 Tax=Maribacter sp. 2210JD10-5 TaxID=3386272 RepID=UPI0039BD56BD
MQLFYSQDINENDSTFTFDATESKHIIKVLRKRTGDTLFITNGNGLLAKGQISDESPKSCTVTLNTFKQKHPDRHYLHMAVAPTKSNDRFEWFLEKATEIGVHEITPIICEHSERKVIKMERMQRIVQAAMKQSLQTYLPKVNEAVSFQHFIETHQENIRFIAHCDPSERFELKRNVAPDKPIIILIGPEGDFSKIEIKNALQSGYLPISMGKNRLRTETAAVVACHTVALINNA